MIRIELKEIVSNYDNKRKALNVVERGNKKTNPQYPYYGANGIVDFIDEYIFDEELLCIAEDGGNWGYKQNCSYIVNGKYWVNNHVHVLKPKKNIEIKYLMYYLNYTDLTSYITGTTRGKLTRTALDKIQINLPELEIQREIVIILDKINNLMEKNKKRIIYLEELVKSRFIEMFLENKKYPIMTLEELTGNKKENLVRGPFGGSLKKDDFIETGYLVYEQKHAIHNDFNYKKYYISKEKYQKMIRFKVESGDLIVSCSGTLGKIAEIPKEYKEGIINQALLKIKLDKNIINNKFFMVLFRMKYNEKELQRVSLGSGISNFPSMKEVRNFDFIVPPLSLQNEFASFVTKTNKLKFEAEKSLKEMENLYESLMQKFFKQN